MSNPSDPRFDSPASRPVEIEWPPPPTGAPDDPPTTMPIHPPHPRDPRDWRWFVRGVGTVLISVGVLVFLFTGYQLWGTGIQEARAQTRLTDDFSIAQARLKATLGTTVAPTTAATTTTTTPASTVAGETTAPTPPPTTTVAPAPGPTPVAVPASAISDGDAMARIEIPRISLTKTVISGVTVKDLRDGPGHFRNTPLPGQKGNAAIAGHRTTYGAPFSRIDELSPGDQIIITDLANQRYIYKVTRAFVVEPSDTSVLEGDDTPMITLSSCEPKYTSLRRIIVQGVLDETVSAPPAPASRVDTTLPPAFPDEPTTTAVSSVSGVSAVPTTVGGDVGAEPATTLPAAGTAGRADVETFQQGWFSDRHAWPPVAIWGLACSAVALLAWFFGRRTRQWLAVIVFVVPFLAVLYFFFENVNRLLPPNL